MLIAPILRAIRRCKRSSPSRMERSSTTSTLFLANHGTNNRLKHCGKRSAGQSCECRGSVHLIGVLFQVNLRFRTGVRIPTFHRRAATRMVGQRRITRNRVGSAQRETHMAIGTVDRQDSRYAARPKLFSAPRRRTLLRGLCYRFGRPKCNSSIRDSLFFPNWIKDQEKVCVVH